MARHCYVLPVKENQPRLLEALQGLFDDAREVRWVQCDSFRTVSKGHDRIESRECCTTSDPEYLKYIAPLADWQGLQSITMVEAVRRIGEQTTTKRRYFISSLESDTGSWTSLSAKMIAESEGARVRRTLQCYVTSHSIC